MRKNNRAGCIKQHIRLHWIPIVCGLVALGPHVRAADTVETWEAGAFDVDFYLGLEGVTAQRNADSATSTTEIMIGYGLTDSLSIYLGAGLVGQKRLSELTGEFYWGVFTTPIDTKMVDLDLFLDFRITGFGFDQLAVVPAWELNLDLGTHWGLYLRSQWPLPVTSGNDDDPLQLMSTVGAYWTIVEGQQLLIEVASKQNITSQPGALVEPLGVALGYNLVVNDTLELVTQVTLATPTPSESWSVGIMTGFVATVPDSRRR